MSELDEQQERKSLQLRDKLSGDFDREKSEAFAGMHRGKAWYDDFILLYEMITDDHYTLSRKIKATIAGTLAYLVLPLDTIPDFLPIVGLLDDAFVLAWTTKTLKDEMDAFKRYKSADAPHEQYA